jgi:peptidoglycan/LPS O-acetylase OafA/YrhL
MGPLDVSNGATFGPGLRCLAGFTLGVAAYRLSRHPVVARLAANSVLTTMVASMILVLVFVPKSDLIIVLLLPMLIIGLSADRSPVAALLALPIPYTMGLLSYSIYLVHLPILLTLKHWLEPRGLPHSGYIIGIGTLALLLPVAALTYILVEHPCRRILRARRISPAAHREIVAQH